MRADYETQLTRWNEGRLLDTTHRVDWGRTIRQLTDIRQPTGWNEGGLLDTTHRVEWGQTHRVEWGQTRSRHRRRQSAWRAVDDVELLRGLCRATRDQRQVSSTDVRSSPPAPVAINHTSNISLSLAPRSYKYPVLTTLLVSQIHTIQYDTRRYFNVRNQQRKSAKKPRKLKSKKQVCSEV